RGFGYSEFHFGLESHITRLAQKIGMDSVEFRKRNAIKEGDTLAYGAKMNACNLTGAIEAVAKEIGWDKKMKPSSPGKALGKGFAVLWKAPAMPPNAASAAFIKFNEDASVNVVVSGMEMGQGYLTVMAQIAAEVLTIPVDKVRVETPDTDRNAYEWQTVGSHVTWGCGNAVKNAAIDARNKIFETVSRALGAKKDSLYLKGASVKSKTDPSFNLAFKDFVIHGIQTSHGNLVGGPILGSGMFMPEFTSALSDPETSQGGHPNVHYTVGASAAIVEIDKETGKVDVKKIVLALDAGKAINPDLVNGQIVGGVVQGLATVLYEDMRFDEKGRLLNGNFTDYKIPTSMDIPDEIVPIIIETPQPDGPFGARGVGEHTMISAAPVIANAIDDALGIRIKTMPITAEKIALAVPKKERKPAR
ncbi:MAG: molybdopterin-dependent oxidoreductase, partial [Elusimicrobia bacterium]|nr:molybdopterin-dependent oxidoreductase [Elusimicrobiota bacterium]